MISASRPSGHVARRLRFANRSLKENFYRAPNLDDMCDALDINKDLSPILREHHDHSIYNLDDILLRLNIGGQPYRLLPETILKRSAESLLTEFVFATHEQRLKLCKGYLNETKEYYFERSPQLFDIVYQFYITGVVHRPSHVCMDVFVTELAFWNIKNAMFSNCAMEMGYLYSESKMKRYASSRDPFKRKRFAKIRRAIWNLLEVPESSLGARVMAWFSLGSILLVTILMVMASIPEFQIHQNVTREGFNETQTITVLKPHPWIKYAEYLCMICFTLEYLTKLIVAADRKSFFFQVLSLVDLVSIVPFYVELVFELAQVQLETVSKFNAALIMMRVLRVSRVIRILKIGRYSSGIRALAMTMSASKKQLSMLGVVLATGIMFFSTLLYNLEKDEPETKFSTIPAAFWWCIVTMTTVGYGDMVPTTATGKMVGTGAIAAGVLVLALPITIIVDNFMQVHEQESSGSHYKERCHVIRKGLVTVAEHQQKAYGAFLRTVAERRNAFFANQRKAKSYEGFQNDKVTGSSRKKYTKSMNSL